MTTAKVHVLDILSKKLAGEPTPKVFLQIL